MTMQNAVKGNGNGHGDPKGMNLKDMRDLKINDIKAIFPDVSQGPIFSPNLESGNPGIRLIANDDNLLDMLKIVYIEDYEMADNVADALGECDEFLLNEDGTANAEVLQRIEWIKYKLAARCSVKGRFADAYKQTATGVLTNAMSEKGWTLLQMPIGKKEDHTSHEKNQQGNRP